MEFDFDFLRIVAAFFVGFCLSISGSLTQHVTQNPIAGPSTMGFDAAAVVCVLFAFIFKSYFSFTLSNEVLGFLFFVLALPVFFIFLRIFKNFGYKALTTYILLGLCFNLFVGAIFSVMQFFFMSLNVEFPSGLWFGNLRFVNKESVLFIGIYGFFLYFITIYLSKKLRLLSLGQGISKNLSLNPRFLINSSLFLSLVTTVIVVNLFGVFSFLSLIFPLTLRSFPFFESKIKNEFLVGSLVVGLFLSVIDLLCYNFPVLGIEFPLGMVSSVVGSLVFMILLFKKFSMNNFAK